jgi:hypothetical protein
MVAIGSRFRDAVMDATIKLTHDFGDEASFQNFI